MEDETTTIVAAMPADDAPPESVDAQTPDAPAAAETAETPRPEPKYATWQEAVADVDYDELVKHPKVAGTFGSRIDRLADEKAKRLADERIAAAEAERGAKEERALRDSDPYAYAERQRAREAAEAARAAAEAARAAEEARANAIGAIVTRTVERYAREVQLPEDVIRQANAVANGKPLDEGLYTWITHTVDGRLAAERKRWEADEMPVLRKKLLAELNGGEPPVQVGGGAVATKGLNFATEEEMAAAHMEGRISTDQARQWHVQHGRRR